MAFRSDKFITNASRKENRKQKGSVGRPRKRRIRRVRRNNETLGDIEAGFENTKYKENNNIYSYAHRLRPTLSYISDLTGLEITQVEILWSAYSFEYFSADELLQYILVPKTYRRNKFSALVSKEFVEIYIQGNYKNGEVNIYRLTKKGSSLAAYIYNVLHGISASLPNYY